MLAIHCDKFAEKHFEILDLGKIKIGDVIEVLLCHKKSFNHMRKHEPTPRFMYCLMCEFLGNKYTQ